MTARDRCRLAGCGSVPIHPISIMRCPVGRGRQELRSGRLVVRHPRVLKLRLLLPLLYAREGEAGTSTRPNRKTASSIRKWFWHGSFEPAIFRRQALSARRLMVFFNGQVRIGMRPLLKYYTQIGVESLPGGGLWVTGILRSCRVMCATWAWITWAWTAGSIGAGEISEGCAIRPPSIMNASVCWHRPASARWATRCTRAASWSSPSTNSSGAPIAASPKKEPWCTGAKAVTEIGFVSTANFHVPVAVAESDLGATNMLAQLHHQFDTLDRESDFSRYKVVILPDTHRFDDDLRQKVSAYLAGGGR